MLYIDGRNGGLHGNQHSINGPNHGSILIGRIGDRVRGAVMARATIDYLNARRAAKAAAGGVTYSREAEQCPDAELDQFEIALGRARSMISDFALWAEASRCQYLNVINIGHQTLTPYQTGADDEIPF